jgi:hypothetical protein
LLIRKQSSRTSEFAIRGRNDAYLDGISSGRVWQLGWGEPFLPGWDGDEMPVEPPAHAFRHLGTLDHE